MNLKTICRKIHFRNLSVPGTYVERIASRMSRDYPISVGDIGRVVSGIAMFGFLKLETQIDGENRIRDGWDPDAFKKVIE